MWELDHKVDWVPKNWCFWTVVLEKTLESPLDNKEIQPVNPKGNQSWIFIGKTDAEAETPILWPPDLKNWLNGKHPDAGKDSRQNEKGTTEDMMVRWHHQLDGHEFGQTLGDGEGQGSLACCSSWSCSWTWLSDWTATKADTQVWSEWKAHLSLCGPGGQSGIMNPDELPCGWVVCVHWEMPEITEFHSLQSFTGKGPC